MRDKPLAEHFGEGTAKHMWPNQERGGPSDTEHDSSMQEAIINCEI